MPYLAHFGLREHPFFLSPTTEHFFPTTESLQLLQLLEQAILRNGGLIKLVGPLSSGKTLTAHLLAQRLMQRSDSTAEVALVTAPKTQGAALITAVCKAFGLATTDPQRKPLDVLGAFLVAQKNAGRPCVLVIDDAQTMGLAGLETAQLLSELENDEGRLIHVVLVGQSSLDAMLAAKPMQKVRQAISFSFSTTPFSPAESRDFIERRIAASRLAGATRDVFDAKALDLVVQVTAGIPGSIIVLCDKAMRIAQEQGYRTVTRAHVQVATLDCPSLAPIAPRRGHHSAFAWIAGIVGCLLGAGVAGTILMSPSTRDALRGWVGLAPQEQTQAKTMPSTQPLAEAGTESAPQAAPEAAKKTPSPAQELQIETHSQPSQQPVAAAPKTAQPTPEPEPEPEPAPTPAPESAAPTNSPADTSAEKQAVPNQPAAAKPEDDLEREPAIAPTTVVPKPTPPEPQPVVPPAPKPDAPQAAPAKPEPEPEPQKPAPAKPAAPTKPAPVEPAPIKPEPVKPEPVKPTPTKPPPAKPAAPAPQPDKYKAKVGPNGELIWD